MFFGFVVKRFAQYLFRIFGEELSLTFLLRLNIVGIDHDFIENEPK